MSRADVNEIGVLESLSQALPQYCERGVSISQGFGSLLQQKIDYFSAFEPKFIAKVEAAEAALSSCEYARACDPPEYKRSCAYQESALAHARALYRQYRTEMGSMTNAYSSYKGSESRYFSSLNTIKTNAVTELNRLIQHLSDYATSANETKI
ncbi:MAG: hypothetical protein FWD60_04405 [Candidatus Azobacteroides sp.]|nr:hypothetical protein [Candidatus Azobacteroides sp.]